MTINSEVVADIQRLLNRDHGFNLKVDGDFGPETFWDNGKTTNAILTVLEKVGGKLAKEPDSHPVNNGKGGRTVFLEIGHGPREGGGYDPGAVRIDPAGNKTEHQLNKIVANAIKARLDELGIPCVVDRDPALKNYSSGRQAAGHDLLVSVHHNSHDDMSRAQGAEAVMDPRSRNPKSDARLCKLLSDAMAKANSIPSRGAKQMKLAVLSGGRSVGVPYNALIETYFVQRRPDANPATADMEEWSRRGGIAAANAIAAFLGTV
jgi:N-acetylmuramoyl-L-alanine amidase